MDIKDHIRTVENFPKPGILFYDISTLLSNPRAMKETIGQLVKKIESYEPEIILGIESRGFLFAPPLAMEMGLPFGMVRKKGKLPGETVEMAYELEYGEDRIEIQKDLVKPGQRVAIIDDLLATGGTMSAAVKLVEKAGGLPVVTAFIMELKELDGKSKLDKPSESLLEVD